MAVSVQLFLIIVAGLTFLLGLMLARRLPSAWRKRQEDSFPLALLTLITFFCWGQTGLAFWALIGFWIESGKIGW